MNSCLELASTAQELSLAHKVLTGPEGAEYIVRTLEKFKPARVTGHLAIHHDSLSIPFEKYEISYPDFMPDEPTCIFFEQVRENVNCVFILEEGRKLSQILENTYRFEYFQSNEQIEYLLAVNWYVIEGIGLAAEWMGRLQQLR